MKVLSCCTAEIGLDLVLCTVVHLPGSAVFGRNEHFVSTTPFFHPFAEPLLGFLVLIVARPAGWHKYTEYRVALLLVPIKRGIIKDMNWSDQHAWPRTLPEPLVTYHSTVPMAHEQTDSWKAK